MSPFTDFPDSLSLHPILHPLAYASRFTLQVWPPSKRLPMPSNTWKAPMSLALCTSCSVNSWPLDELLEA